MATRTPAPDQPLSTAAGLQALNQRLQNPDRPVGSRRLPPAPARRLQCPRCTQTFPHDRSNNLRRHLREVHDHVTPPEATPEISPPVAGVARPPTIPIHRRFCCSVCHHTAGRRDHVNRHLQVHVRLGDVPIERVFVVDLLEQARRQTTSSTTVAVDVQDPVPPASPPGPEQSTTAAAEAVLQALTVEERGYLHHPLFQRVLARWRSIVDHEFCHTPCAFCGLLLFPRAIHWRPLDQLFTYPLVSFYDRLPVRKDIGTESEKVACCKRCGPLPESAALVRAREHRLGPWPEVLQTLPSRSRLFLSPLTFFTNLGRTLGATTTLNPARTYRTVSGQMQVTRNLRATALYSGLLGAFLESSSAHATVDVNHDWQHLQSCRAWLLANNPLFLQYYPLTLEANLPDEDASSIDRLPRWETSTTEERRPPNRPDLILNPAPYPVETHDEHFRTRHLPNAELLHRHHLGSFNKSDPTAEALLFPCLYPRGVGQYQPHQAPRGRRRTHTLASDAKRKLNHVTHHFRGDHYWPPWIYMRLEDERIFANSMRIMKCQTRQLQENRLRTSDLIQQSSYGAGSILNENLTQALPAGIRTGDTYFLRAEANIRALLRARGKPAIFLTLTFSESWPGYRELLAGTGDGDTLPTNRPWEAVHYYQERLRHLKIDLLRSHRRSGFGGLLELVERQEFQQRGAIYTHMLLWTESGADALISKGFIRADLPDQALEPELYQAVTKHQIHRCHADLCRKGPLLDHECCSKGFPAPLSQDTHRRGRDLRYTYRRSKDEDRWVVPYTPTILLLWDAHCNVQYCTDGGLAHYISKYVTKPEPDGLYHPHSPAGRSTAQQHFLARRMGAMETMILLLGYHIFHMSVACRFLMTAMPQERDAQVKPVWLLEQQAAQLGHDQVEEEEDLFYVDNIQHYLGRPREAAVEGLTYFEYYANYRVTRSPLGERRRVGRDHAGYYVTQRLWPQLIRTTFRRLQDGESFFYHELLLRKPWRSEEELLDGHSTYRAHFLARWPDAYRALLHGLQETRTSQVQVATSSYHDAISLLTARLPRLQKELVQSQLQRMEIEPLLLTGSDYIFNLQDSQYRAYQRLTTSLARQDVSRSFCFFVTGCAGTGKSHLLHALYSWCRQRRLLAWKVAPTGIAACNVDGKTLHSALQITQASGGGRYHCGIFRNDLHRASLQALRVLIIDEISMVSAELLTYVSKILAMAQDTTLAFGGVHVVCFGDLLQLPPVKGRQVFKSPLWPLFFPLFLTTSQRHSGDMPFSQMLDSVRRGQLSETVWQRLVQKASSFDTDSLSYEETILVSKRHDAARINQILISQSLDYEDGHLLPPGAADRSYRREINLPSEVHLAIGNRVMYLNNTLFSRKISNGTTGVIVAVSPEGIPQVAFPTRDGLQTIEVRPTTVVFSINGIPYSRRQLPIQDAFALTVHKTQGLTLDKTAVLLNEDMFAPGHAYTALSRVRRWEDVDVMDLHPDAFRVDHDAVAEYRRLEQLAQLLS